MPRVVFGTGLPREGTMEIHAVTLGELVEKLEEAEPWLAETDVRYFVDGVDAQRLEGPDTPVGDEDTVLVVPG